MVYLDYSATTPVDKEVLDTFNKVSIKYFANPNSLHKLGIEANELIKKATDQIADILKVKSSEIIYTSGASESNNMAIKGIIEKYHNRGKKVITTPLEHSSVYAVLNYLVDKYDIEVIFVNLKKDGTIDLDHLKTLLDDEVILVTMSSVNSELGILEPIEQIGKIIKEYPKCYFHVDMTQSMGKIDIPLANVDLATIDAHKFYGLKGIGALIKKEKIMIEPLIHGGKSTTIFRSGTPATPLIASLAKALRLSYLNINQKYDYVLDLNKYLKNELSKRKGVYINSSEEAIPFILNISVPSIKPETFMHALSEHEIYISTKTACSSTNNESKAVYAISNDMDKAISSLRISLSHLTTKTEIDYFLKYFDICYDKLKMR